MSLLSLIGITSAYAAAPAPTTQGSLMSLLPMLIIFVGVAYFLIIRPQAKRAKEQKKLMSDLSIGDEVMTAGGIVGRIEKLNDGFIRLSLGTTEITIQKSSIANILPKGTLESMQK